MHDDYVDHQGGEAEEIARLHYESMRIDDQLFADAAPAAVDAAKKRSEDMEVTADIPDFITSQKGKVKVRQASGTKDPKLA